MSSHSTSLYTGNYDWIAIYRSFYSIEEIVAQINMLLPTPTNVAFSGFAEVAARLSTRHAVHFIEYSASMIDAARQEFPILNNTSHVNVLDAVSTEPAKALLVLCRISAYWHSSTCLQTFITNASAENRETIAIDFFDADNLETGKALGNVAFSSIREVKQPAKKNTSDVSLPTVKLATVKGSYPLAGKTNSFTETRAYYRSQEVLGYAEHHLRQYDVSIEPPIIKSDPGFTLVARRSSASMQQIR